MSPDPTHSGCWFFRMKFQKSRMGKLQRPKYPEKVLGPLDHLSGFGLQDILGFMSNPPLFPLHSLLRLSQASSHTPQASRHFQTDTLSNMTSQTLSLPLLMASLLPSLKVPNDLNSNYPRPEIWLKGRVQGLQGVRLQAQSSPPPPKHRQV